MGDPELRSDEKVLVRTNGIFVKSLPFEGILTNRRIFLIDKSKNMRPPKEISLATIKDIDAGENAIRDQIITLSMVAKTGELRQMILTFSRQTGGNRIKERDEWVKLLKRNTGQVFEQAVRRNISPAEEEDSYQEKPEPSLPPIEIVNSPLRQSPPSRIPIRKEIEQPRPVKRIIESVPARDPSPAPSPTPEPTPGPAPEPEPVPQSSVLGLYCTRCGNKLAEGSAFCNRCGGPVNIPVTPSIQASAPGRRSAVAEPVEPPVQQTPEGQREIQITGQISIPEEELSWEDMPEHVSAPTHAKVRREAYDAAPEPESYQAPAPMVQTPPARPAKPVKAKKGLLPRLFSARDLGPTPLKPESMPTRGGTPPAPKKPKRTPSSRSFRPGKRTIFTIIGIVVIIAVVLVGALVVYPMISKGGVLLPGSTSDGVATTPTPATTGAPASTTPSSSGTLVIPKETQAVTIPSTGVWVHVNYIGGFKGTYGLPDDLQTAADSGEKIYEVLNATGPVRAEIAKTDKSTRHAITVEIYKNGKVLTSGTTDASLGKVTLSVNTLTGIAETPVISPSTSLNLPP